MDLEQAPATPRTRWARFRAALPWIILVASVVYLVWVRWADDLPFQSRNMRATLAVLISSTSLLLWWMLLSGRPWKRRWAGLGVVLAGVGLMALVFRYDGVSGDLLPEFSFRWTERGSRTAPSTATVNPAVEKPGGGSATHAVGGVNVQAGPRDFPQFLGPRRNGELNGIVLQTNWVQHPPRVLWKASVGEAWSGFAVVGDLAVTQEQHGEEERTVARQALTGAILWSHADPARYDNPIAGMGPRATPTVLSNRVLTLGATGWLTCLDLEGRKIWQRDMKMEHGAKIPDWGFTSAPLLVGEWVVVSVGARPGKSLVAHRLSDGGLVWSAGDGHAGFSAPIHVELAGQPMVVIFNDTAVFGHRVTDGKILWQHPWPGGHPHVAVPALWKSDQLLVSSGYGTGSQLVKIHGPGGTNTEWRAERMWKTTRFRNKFSNPVVRGDFAYGLDDGVLACQELATGELRWKGERHGHGQVLLVGEVLLVTAETGEVMLYAVSPEGPQLLAKHAVLEGKTWNPPALAGDLLLMRNASMAVCLRVALQ